MAGRGLAGHPKKGADERAHVVLIDESGLFLNPVVRRTWAPVGRTPRPDAWGRHRDEVGVIGAVSISPVAHRPGFYFATDPGGYFAPEKVVAFLRELLEHLRGKVIVLWDGGPNHEGPAVRKFLARNGRRRLERLPGYSPDPNPVEAVWSWPKYGKLANFVPRGIDPPGDWVLGYPVELKCRPRLSRQLWEGPGLPFPAPLVKHPGQPADQ